VRERNGLNARQMLEQPLQGYLLFGVEPWSDAGQGDALSTLKKAGFVVAVTPYASAQMRSVAHVLLPAGSFAESSGTYVNLEGRWQSFAGAARPLGESRPGWKVLRVLGNALDAAGFDYQSSEQVRDELQALIARAPKLGYQGSYTPGPGGHAANTVDVPMYQIDPLLRRAPSLQRTRAGTV
jgi:NADH-quinone oxidoreductase subunit G